MSSIAQYALLVVAVVVLAVSRPSGLDLSLERIRSLTGSHVLCFGLGFLFFPLAKHVRIRKSRSGASGHEDDGSAVYGLDHGRLNITLPPPTMWMNMGYWKNTLDFPTACRALLEEVLITARLLTPEKASLSCNLRRPITIIDLGFGCGDQTIYLVQDTLQTKSITNTQRSPLIERYIGITLNRTQFQYAKIRLTALGLLDSKTSTPSIQIFCADAARPASWSPELTSATQAASAPPPPPTDALESASSAGSSSRETWILALDTLYHFRPSRQPILAHAYHDLHASLMAFDLLRSASASLLQRAVLAVVALLTGAPPANFMTEAEYRRMLVEAGYAEDGIEIRDVSEHVFAPLARFLGERERRLGEVGLGIGAFRVARWMFGWWGRSGVVRGVVVVARR